MDLFCLIGNDFNAIILPLGGFREKGSQVNNLIEGFINMKLTIKKSETKNSKKGFRKNKVVKKNFHCLFETIFITKLPFDRKSASIIMVLKCIQFGVKILQKKFSNKIGFNANNHNFCRRSWGEF